MMLYNNKKSILQPDIFNPCERYSPSLTMHDKKKDHNQRRTPVL